MDAMNPIELDSFALSSTVAFTGRLACMTRAEAFEVVRSHGGTPSQTVSRQTNVLVVGELGWPLLDDGRPSNKLSRAGSYGIPVVSERRFLAGAFFSSASTLARRASIRLTTRGGGVARGASIFSPASFFFKRSLKAFS
jgi:BRCA1 C Terminus (BRCT) domain